MTNILELNHLGAEEYFLRSKSYCNIELPQYFSFNEILEKELGGWNEKEI